MNQLSEISEEKIIETCLYETPLFHQCWQEYLAPKFDIVLKQGDYVIQRKSLVGQKWLKNPIFKKVLHAPIFKDLTSLREARLSGWNSSWRQDLSMHRVKTLHTLPGAWDYFRMTLMDSRRDPQTLNWLRNNGYLVIERPAPVQYWIDLSDGFEGYLKGLSHNSRKSLKKKTRVGQVLNPVIEPCNTDSHGPEAVDAFFEELFMHHIAYWDVKAGYSYFNDIREQRFIVNWAKSLLKDNPDSLILDRLLLNGETANMSMGIRQGDTFYWLLTINTGLHMDYAPGIIGLTMRLDQLAAQGVTQFKMGPGDYFYKIQSANRQDACQDLIVCNPRSLKGRAYFYAMNKSSKENKPSQEAMA